MRTDNTLPGIVIKDEYAGLITQCLSVGDPSLTATTANRFSVGCLLQDISVGTNYENTGSSASPVWTIASGDITAVLAGNGATGGGITGPITLGVGVTAKNTTGADLTKGMLVFVVTTGPAELEFLLAKSLNAPPAFYVVSETIPDGAVGAAYQQALVKGLDTSGAQQVTSVAYLSPTVNGGWTFTEPTDPQASSEVAGIVVKKDATDGWIFFFPGVAFTSQQPTKQGKLYTDVINATGGAVGLASLFSLSGWDATAGKPKIVLADADNGIPATHVLYSGLSDGQSTAGLAAGILGGLNTSGAGAVGDPVYLSTTPGGWTFTAPTAANALVQQVGIVVVKDAAVGQIFFFPSFGKITKIGTGQLQSGLVPSHVAKFAGTSSAFGGGGTTFAITVTGALATDIANAVIRASTNAVSIVKATLTADTLTITFSADPGAATTIDYSVLRLVA